MKLIIDIGEETPDDGQMRRLPLGDQWVHPRWMEMWMGYCDSSQ